MKVVAGALPLEELRSAALAIVTISLVENDVLREALAVPLPGGTTPSWSEEDGLHLRGLWTRGSSARTWLSWTYRLTDGREMSGGLSWPDSSDIARAGRCELAGSVEKHLTEACPAERPTFDQITSTRRPSVNRIDDPKGVSSVEDDLFAALLAWQPAPGCTLGPRDAAEPRPPAP